MNLRIGVYSDSYPDKRMILNKVPDVQYTQIVNRRENIGRALRVLGRNLPEIRQTEFYAQGVHFILDAPCYPKIDLIHTFNRVCLHDRNRWVATFEKTFPEYFSEESRINYRLMRKQLPLILSEKCLSVLPMSHWACNYELWLLSQFASQNEIERIKGKMTVLYPPQDLLLSSEEIQRKFEHTQKIKFLYVGSQVKRKGGAEILRVFDQLRAHFDTFSLTFVGKLDDNYNNFYLDEKETEDIHHILAHADWLDYHERVSNEEVIDFAKQAHVGLLPSMGDTFGFSVLEMQACGCPVITTDRQALPEINNNDCGWILNMEELRLPHGDDFAHYTRSEVEALSESIRIQLKNTITAILINQSQLKQKAEKSRERVERIHSPKQYAEQLKQIYTSQPT